MFSAFEWMVAMRYLRARRQEGAFSIIAWFAVIGIALGVATLIIVMSVMNGFRHDLLSLILGFNGHLGVYAQTGPLTGFDPLAKKVRGIDGVVLVTPIIEGQVLATSKGTARGVVVHGMRPDDLRARKIIADNIQAGSLEAFRGGDAVLIGARLAQTLGVVVGQKITLISPKGNVTAFGTVPRMGAYRVAAVFNIGMFEYDSGFVFMPLEAAQLYFKMPGAVTNLEVFVDDPDRSRAIGRKVMDSVNAPIRVHDWQQANASFFNALKVERNVMFIILVLIVLVAVFNIISMLILLVQYKGHDIAILRTMGATRGVVMRIFFLAGASVGVIGNLAGVVLGLTFCENIETIRQWIEGLTGSELFSAEIYFLSKLPAVVDPDEVIAVVVVGLALSFLATLYPSWRAARLDPAEALRYE